MKLSTIPKDYIINASVQNGGKVVSNFLLHGLKIQNVTDESIILKDVSFELYSSGTIIKQVSYQGNALENKIKEFAENYTWLNKGFGAKLFLGEENFWTPELYTKSIEMNLNQQTGIFNEYFVIVYENTIDELVIKASYSKSDEIHVQELRVPIVYFKSKNNYIFPLKGTFLTSGNFNCLVDHRQHFSMEFAFDMVQLDSEQKLCYKDNMKEENYKIYGENVLSIADGEVVDCYQSFSMISSWDWEIRKPYIDKYGLAAQCGNYIVIKHANDEYSFYGHLITDSLTVKKGTNVKQGQIIAKVGHTGLSNCPHLHFQLMNGPDFLTARGLPCSFTNIKDVLGNTISFIEEDNIIVHAK